MSRNKTKPFLVKPSVTEITRFLQSDIGKLCAGQLTDVDNMPILSGGALRSMLREKQIVIPPSEELAGVYTLTDVHDPAYEIPTSASWVYAHICPASVLQYAGSLDTTSRMLVGSGGKPGKTADGYRNILAAFSDGETIYVLYDAVYNIIDQRREMEYTAVGTGIVVQLNGMPSASLGTRTIAYTLTQLWMDTIDRNGNVTALLIDGNLKKRKEYSNSVAKATLISADKKNFRYCSADWLPQIGAAYSASPDAMYETYYPALGSAYALTGYYASKERHIVRYNNRSGENGGGEQLLVLPDMLLLSCQNGIWSQQSLASSVPKMTAAVQHFERLYGIAGNTLYASAAGNCTEYTEAVDGLPVTAAWKIVTADIGGFTAITSFDGKVIVFTASSMMTVRGTELPFSLSYVGAYGCPSSLAVVAYGDWLYFSSGETILRYNGSRVENIGDVLPREYTFSKAKLSVANGMILVTFPEFSGMYFFDPQSACWSKRSADAGEFLDGGGDVLLRRNGTAKRFYRIFAENGSFSAAVSLGMHARRCIRAVTLTAFLESGAVLQVKDGAGNSVMTLYGESKTVNATTHLRGTYADCGNLSVAGSGDVTLYGMRVQHTPTGNALRQIG